MEKIINFLTNILYILDNNFFPYTRELYIYENNKYRKYSFMSLYFYYYLNYFFSNLISKNKNNYIVLYKLNNNYNYRVFYNSNLSYIYNFKFNNNNKNKIAKPIRNIYFKYNNEDLKQLNNLINFLYMFDNNSKLKEIILFQNIILNNIEYIDINFLRAKKRIKYNEINELNCIDIFK
jgi:hypothetical protein